jgi:hypothetical protein
MEKLVIKANDEYKKLKSKIEAESKYSEKYHDTFSGDRDDDEDEYFDGGSEYLLKDSKKKKILINSKYEEYSIIYQHVIRTYIELFCSFILTDESKSTIMRRIDEGIIQDVNVEKPNNPGEPEKVLVPNQSTGYFNLRKPKTLGELIDS